MKISRVRNAPTPQALFPVRTISTRKLFFFMFSQNLPCCNFLYLKWGNTQHQSRSVDEEIESSPAEIDLGVLVDKIGHDLAMCACSLESQDWSLAASKKLWSAGQGKSCCHDTPPGALHLEFWSPQKDYSRFTRGYKK